MPGLLCGTELLACTIKSILASLRPLSRAGYEYDAAVMITASHLPYNRNGFKFFTKEGGYEKKDITELLTKAAEEHAAESAPNTAADARYRDDAFVLSSALQSEPGLIELVSAL